MLTQVRILSINPSCAWKVTEMIWNCILLLSVCPGYTRVNDGLFKNYFLRHETFSIAFAFFETQKALGIFQFRV